MSQPANDLTPDRPDFPGLDTYRFDLYANYGIKKITPSRVITLTEFLELISSDRYEQAIQRIRSQSDEKRQKELKDGLDYVTPSGTFFPTRNEANLKEHSGLLVIDFDKVENLWETRLQLQADPYTLVLFTSPRGNGLKLLVRIDPERHRDSFYDIGAYYKLTYGLEQTLDTSGPDPCRACFVTYEPRPFVNPQAEFYQVKGLVEKKPPKPRTPAQQVADASDTYRHVLAVVERIEAAQVDITGGPGEYDTRLLVAFCMSTLGEDGRDLLHRVLSFYPNYTAEETDSKFDQGRDTSRFTTPWKFFDLAKDYGIDVTKPKREKPTTKKTVKGQSADTQPPAVPPVIDPPGETPPVRAARQAKEFNWETNGTVTYDLDEMEIRVKAGKSGYNTIADNFLLYVKYMTEDENENLSWVIEIRTERGDSIYVEVPHEEFNSAAKLKRIISGKQFALKISDGELSELPAFLFSKTRFDKAVKIIRYGYHAPSGVFFFANKAVVDGQILAPDQFNMINVQREGSERFLSMPANNRHKAHRFTLTDQQLSVNKFFAVYAQAHGYDNAAIPFCFYMMALFRDLALKHKNFSPILMLKGGAGTGKSSAIRVLTSAFGRKQEGVNLKSGNTETALAKLMSQASNCIIWFDEFNNEIKCEGLLQAAYDNDGYHLTKAGTVGTNETDSIDIYSALALTTNYLPDNPIFFSRCVLVAITSQDKTEEQVTAYNQLEAWQEDGLGCLTLELLQHRALIETQYAASYTLLFNGLRKAFGGERIPERFYANMAQVLTVGFILASTGKIAMTQTTDIQDVLAEFVALGVANIRRQFRIVSEKTALSEFLEIVQQLYDQYQIHDQVHFDLVATGKELSIELWFPQLYNLYAQQYRRTNQRAPADRDSLQQEIAAFEEYPDWDTLKKPIRFVNDGEGSAKGKTTPRPNCCVMNYSKLQEKYGLDLEARKPRSQ